MMKTGSGETVVQTAGGVRSLVDCSVNPTGVLGQLRMTFVPAGVIVRSGLTTGRVMLKIVPLP